MRRVLKKVIWHIVPGKQTHTGFTSNIQNVTQVLSATGWSNKHRLLSGYKLLALVFLALGSCSV